MSLACPSGCNSRISDRAPHLGASAGLDGEPAIGGKALMTVLDGLVTGAGLAGDAGARPATLLSCVAAVFSGDGGATPTATGFPVNDPRRAGLAVTAAAAVAAGGADESASTSKTSAEWRRYWSKPAVTGTTSGWRKLITCGFSGIARDESHSVRPNTAPDEPTPSDRGRFCGVVTHLCAWAS